MDEIEGYKAKLSLLSEKNQVCTKFKTITQTRMFHKFFLGGGCEDWENVFYLWGSGMGGKHDRLGSLTIVKNSVWNVFKNLGFIILKCETRDGWVKHTTN